LQTVNCVQWELTCRQAYQLNSIFGGDIEGAPREPVRRDCQLPLKL